MKKLRVSLVAGLIFVVLPYSYAWSSQAPRKAAATGVTGTYKDVLNTIAVLEMPDHKVRIRFVGVYPNERRRVETRNMGAFDEVVKLEGKTATVKIQFGDEPCIVKLEFQPTKITVEQTGSLMGCGFGFNVEPDGSYRKVSSKPPDLPPMSK